MLPWALPGAYYESPDDGGAGEVRLRDRHQSFRTGAATRVQRAATGAAAVGGGTGAGLGALAAEEAAAAARKFRRRWDDSAGGGSGNGGGGGGGPERDEGAGAGDGGPPGGRSANTGHIVRMRRSEAWAKFLAYEGSCQVCMVEGAGGVAEASYFLSSGCAPLRAGLGISGLLLPPVLPAHVAASEGAAIDLGNEIVWDDCDGGRALTAAAFVNRMSVIKVRGAGASMSLWPRSQETLISAQHARAVAAAVP